MTQDELRFQKMTESKLSVLILTLGIPTLIGMLVTSFYNLVDTYFVSNLGTSQSGAVSVVFSLMSIIQAAGFGFGMGCGSLISRTLGEKDMKKAGIFGSSALAASMLFGFLILVPGIVFSEPLVLILGAKGDIIPHAISYARIILYGAPIMCASFVLNNILRAQGKTFSSMCGLTCGGILNIILDYIFIRNLHLGVSGAAWATIASQFVSFCILFFMTFSKSNLVRLRFSYISKTIRTYVLIIKTGLPTFFRQGLASLSTAFLNHIAGSLTEIQAVNEALIAAVGISNKIYMFIRSVVIGFGQGYQPVVGYNFGAKHFERVKKAFWIVILYSTVFCILAGIFLIPAAEPLMKFFIKDSDPIKEGYVIEMGKNALWLMVIALPFLGYSTITNQTLQVLGKSGSATFLASCRQGIFYIPLILTLPIIWGVFGVQFTQPFADLLTFAVTIPIQIHFFHSLREKS